MASLPKLDETSILSVVEANFKRAGLKTYKVRLIYIGDHAAPREAMIEEVRKTVNVINGQYCDIHLTGLLLVYDSYFVHIIEGSEDTIHRMLRFLFKTDTDWREAMDRKDAEELEALRIAAKIAEEEGQPFVWPEEPETKPDRFLFRRLKMLMVYNSVQKNLFKDWTGIVARPPSLVGVLDVNASLPEHMEQLKICLDKISRLCDLAAQDEHLSFEGLSAADPKMNTLPEAALLELLMQSRYTLDLYQVIHKYRRVDDYVFYFEKVWPLPNHFTPRHLYKLKLDDSFVEPLPVMPWELVKKKKEENEEDEDQEWQSESESD